MGSSHFVMIATIVPFSLLSLAPPPPLAEKAGPVDKTVFIAPRPMISHNFGPELMALTCSDPFNADRCSEHDLHCKEVMKDPSKQGTFFCSWEVYDPNAASTMYFGMNDDGRISATDRDGNDLGCLSVWGWGNPSDSNMLLRYPRDHERGGFNTCEGSNWWQIRDDWQLGPFPQANQCLSTRTDCQLGEPNLLCFDRAMTKGGGPCADVSQWVGN